MKRVDGLHGIPLIEAIVVVHRVRVRPDDAPSVVEEQLVANRSGRHAGHQQERRDAGRPARPAPRMRRRSDEPANALKQRAARCGKHETA